MKKRRRMIWTVVSVVGGCLLVWVGLRVWAGWAGPAGGEGSLGVSGGQLAACPSTPNCVATRGASPGRTMAPLAYQGDRGTSHRRLLAVLSELPRMRVVTSNEHYVHAEARSLLVGFVDDVEFQFDDDEKVIHFRSASRLGRSDLGVNRARMEQIRGAYDAFQGFDEAER